MTAQLGRFTVRDLYPWDAEQLFALTGDPLVTRYLGFRTHASIDEAIKLIGIYQNSPSKWQAICTENRLLGAVGFEVRRHQATMSIMIGRDRAARGVGREFGAPFSQWILSHTSVWRLWSYVHVDNVAGQRVTERSGATREGLLRRFEYFPNVSTEPQDCYVYSIVRQNAKAETPSNMDPIPAPLA